MAKRMEQLTEQHIKALLIHEELQLRSCLEQWVSELEPVMVFKGMRFCGVGIATRTGDKCRIVIRVPKPERNYAAGRFIDERTRIASIIDDDDA